MTHGKAVFEIARWEFRRWFKIKDQLWALLISLALGLVFWGGMALLALGEGAPVKLSVIDPGALPLPESAVGRLEFESASPADERALRDQVGRREIDGLLIVRSTDEVELIVFKQPVWRAELDAVLTDARKAVKFGELDLPVERIDDAFRSPTVVVSIHESGEAPTSQAEKITAVIVVILMIFGVMNGVAYQFVSITGEKQLRLTEVIVSAITPQQWIDGKILGTALNSLAGTVTYAGAVLLFVLVSIPFGSGWSIPIVVTRPFVLVSLVAVGLAGYLFWCTLFGAIAATINDPNTSARSALLLVPALPIGFALFALKNPDSLAMTLLSLFPVTSPGVLPARLVLTDVSWWEVTVAVLLLGLSIALLRTAAGRIFRLGMLMHGKEPSLSEMLRWARKA